MHGLEDGVRIDVCIEVKKGIDMYAVDTAGGVVGGAEILRGSPFRAAEKSGREAVGGQVAVSVVCGGEARQPADGIVEARKDGFQGFGLKFRALLVQRGEGWHFLVQPPEVQHLHPGRRRAFRDKERNKGVRCDFPLSAEILCRIDSKLPRICGNGIHGR